MDDIFRPRAKPAFSNSMEYDNEPGDDTSTCPEDDRDGMGPERKASKGTNGSVGVNPGYPLPPDPHAPHGDDGDNDLQSIQELGVDESKDVGHNASINQYGLVK